MILITGGHKAFALYKAIEEGINHMWTVSAFQQHPHTLMVCDEDATLELRVKTVKYFKVLMLFLLMLGWVQITTKKSEVVESIFGKVFHSESKNTFNWLYKKF